ncbi:hypothetical protein FA09DRAFT_286466, partial [Tilletiopsis washingtonensis]
MGRIRHKRTHHARRDVSRGARTRARHLDADQVHANLSNPAKSDALLAPAALDIDAPGLGLFYCIPCDRHFPSEKDRATHQASKLHKRAAKRALEEPHTVEAAERAAGVGVDNRQR